MQHCLYFVYLTDSGPTQWGVSPVLQRLATNLACWPHLVYISNNYFVPKFELGPFEAQKHALSVNCLAYERNYKKELFECYEQSDLAG